MTPKDSPKYGYLYEDLRKYTSLAIQRKSYGVAIDPEEMSRIDNSGSLLYAIWKETPEQAISA